MAYFLTADGGTESIRARVYDLSGTCLASAAVPYETKFSSGARAEQNPEDWWSSFVQAARRAISESAIDPAAIEAITLATTSCTVVALDADGKPLRPSIIWMDVRASDEAEAVLATGDDALLANGGGRGPVSAEWMIPKALWIARNEPEIFEKAETICEYQDFMTLRLTGEKAASLNNVSLRWHYSTDRGGFPKSLLEKLGLEALLQKWPSRVVAPGEVIANLSANAASELGLSQKVKVVQGGADALIGMIGLGVAKPGQLALITGSSHLQFGVSDKPLHAPGIWGSYPDMVYPKRYIIEGGQTSTGSVIAWLGRMMNGTMDIEELNRKAAALEPGADGLLVQDHFQGNRTPYTDALSRGAIVGLTLAHEPHHVFRAIMEGISFGTRAILDAMAEAGYSGQEITVGGGASASPLWLQIHADTAGLPVCVPQSRDAPSVGAAVLAAHGAGHFASIDDGIAAMVKPGTRIEPRPRETAIYNEIYQQYRALYPALKSVRGA
ncbi:carbohydrate kinase [Ochrobactrum sp. MYb15]|uniref:FGGY-family carbohydrate kinase n=1 Tax=Brucella TaxID=234 RepID=UPI000467E42C|nr:FGGY-family carbohydrate kinase [Brucella rhizosphaerae]PQZ50072.1 carbohydrate kinase [Ochrobactrum sp. MYb19]PRA55040.1 carbohydrate kinase [Ochrobactrum sp. MYb68]PRA68114.1 carbohydrate kinase [Ochrobactrum sp. MYb18]PRA74658.1 carbohydrate kinase [Brucella thiophenivorans]PRA90364.1 carbohydrate kinase [Ochrobactrum sp. MYb14]PRA95815.1 carbohydrate kinase [Ochrobactrum sp. MYb15]